MAEVTFPAEVLAVNEAAVEGMALVVNEAVVEGMALVVNEAVVEGMAPVVNEAVVEADKVVASQVATDQVAVADRAAMVADGRKASPWLSSRRLDCSCRRALRDSKRSPVEITTRPFWFFVCNERLSGA